MLTNRAKVLENKKLSFAERIYLPAILGGLVITFKHIFKKKVTIQYPEQKREFSNNYRGQHVLKRDEKGAERCTACGLCAVSCPAEAITMVAAERKPGEEHLYREEKYAATYEINMLRCIFCGLCAVSCPAEAITMVAAERKPGEEHLYREEKYAATYEINMLRCIFCGLCEEACPKEAIYLTDRITQADYERQVLVYDKSILVEKIDQRIDVSKRKELAQ